MSLIGPDPSPIYHFFSKLLWVKDQMATPTGKSLADIRHQRMLKFLSEYRAEMHLEDAPPLPGLASQDEKI
jgi:HD superfamily phosphodiesterase